MAVFRVERTQNYTVMSNYHLRDKTISFKAKGLLSLMLSLPEDWDYTLAGLTRISLEGKDAIRAAVVELEKAGYVTRSRVRNEKGHLQGTEYVIRERPVFSAQPALEEPASENPTLEDTTQLNKDKNKITDSQITESFPFPSSLPTAFASVPAQPSEAKGRKRSRSSGVSQGEMDTYREMIRENIGYDDFVREHPYDAAQLDEMVELMVEAVCSRKKNIRVAGNDFPQAVVKSRLLKLDSEHIRFVFDCLRENTTHLFRGLRCLLRGQMVVEVLDALSIGISLLRGDFSTASSVRFLLGLGELLEEWTHKKSVSDLAQCMSLNIDRVWLKTPQGEILTPLSQIQTGDQVCVRLGGLIPLDGVITEGEVMVNQASLTGESIPVPKRTGMTVYAGTVVEEGECVLQVSGQSGSSRYDKIVAMIEQSESLKSTAESRAANLADRLVPYTLVGSLLTYLLTRNVSRALSVLMVDFSCALKLAMPLAVLSAMREASGFHVTVKGGKYLETVAQADTVVFDKTGTLTHACPVVAEVIPFGGQDEADMLRLAACLEEHFPHSMANAVVQAARERGLSHEEMHSEVEYIVAHGIVSEVNGQRVIIGSAHFVFEDEHCAIPEGEQERYDSLPDQYSHLYLAIGGVLSAVVCISDPLRPEAGAVIRQLRGLGIQRAVMLTGDSERTAAAIAAEVGVDEYHAEILPADKASFVETERAKGHTVIMIGDGINDSPALSKANVGIAISDGAAIAREIADITIAADDLHELVSLRRIAGKLTVRIRSNYRFVMGFNGSLIALGAFGVQPPATSAMLHNLSTLGVSLRSMTNLLEPS